MTDIKGLLSSIEAARAISDEDLAGLSAYAYTLVQLRRAKMVFGDWESSHGYEDDCLAGLIRRAAEGEDIKDAASAYLVWDVMHGERVKWYA